MDFLTDPQFWSRWLRIVFIDLALAGDNAVVIALAVRSLPAREQFFGRVFGTLGAVVLRELFVFVVTQLLRVPFLQLVCGLLLIWIAVKLVRPGHAEDGRVRSGTTLKEAIGVIILADVVMSLDNVIAIAAAAQGDLVLVIFGLLLSIPLVVWGSGILARLMNRFPLIIWLGGGVLGFVAVDLILRDGWVVAFLGARLAAVHHTAPSVCGTVIAGLGWWWSERRGPLTGGGMNPEPPEAPHRLSADLRALLREAAGRSMTLGEIEQILQGRGFGMLLLLLALPFTFPIAIPGLSVPFGLVIMLIGVRLAAGQKPWLPAFILRREIKYTVLEKIVGLGLKLSVRLEKVVKPRMHFLQRWPGMLNLIGLGIASGGLLLSLPLPPLIPFSNTIPAFAVLFLTAGMIERDGLLVLLGHCVNVAAWIYFSVMFAAAGHGISRLWQHFGW